MALCVVLLRPRGPCEGGAGVHHGNWHACFSCVSVNAVKQGGHFGRGKVYFIMQAERLNSRMCGHAHAAFAYLTPISPVTNYVCMHVKVRGCVRTIATYWWTNPTARSPSSHKQGSFCLCTLKYIWSVGCVGFDRRAPGPCLVVCVSRVGSFVRTGLTSGPRRRLK